MELCLELSPDRYVIVIGPQFVTALLTHNVDKAPTLYYSDIVLAGIGVASATIHSESERTKFELLHKNAYELDPLFAYTQVSTKLRKLGLYDQWLRNVFECPHDVSSADSLQHLLDLQKKGALLVYTQCDDTLDRAVNQPPVLMENAASWASGETPGFLHVHGIYSKPSSVVLDYDFYDNNSSPHQRNADGRAALCDYLKGRRALCIGFDSYREDPLQARFLESLGRNVEPDHRHHMIITSVPRADDAFLTLPAPAVDVKSLEGVLKTMAGSSQALWNQIEFPSNHLEDCLVISLLVAGKQGCSEISSMMFKAPGVNFALISPVSYGGGHVHTVLIRVQAAQLQSLWNWIFVSENPSLVVKGLVGVALRCGTIIWIKGRPPANSGGLSVKEECANALLCLRDSSPRSGNDSSLNETLMKNLLLSKSTALAPPPLTRIPNLHPSEAITTATTKARSAQPCCTSSSSSRGLSYSAGEVKVELDGGRRGDPLGAGHAVLPELSKFLCRRGSLPPQLLNRAPEDERTSPLASLDGMRVLPPHTSSSPLESRAPYVLKASLLERGRKRNSIAPGEGAGMLRHLLQSKSAPAAPTGEGMFKRRRSDPGRQGEDLDTIARRKELFVKESRLWSELLQKSIERKTAKRSRGDRKPRSTLQGGGDKPGRATPPVLPPPPLPVHSFAVGNQPSVSASTAMVTKVTPTATPAVVLQARFPAGVNPYMFPQPMVAVSASSSTAPSMLYNPLLPSYAFYHPAAAQGPAYLVPPNSAGRKVLYFMPTSNPSVPVVDGGATTYPSMGVPLNLVSPVVSAVKQEASKGPPPQTPQRGCNQVLSALLKNPSPPADRDGSDPETPPPTKRKRSGDSTATSEGSPCSPLIGKDLRMLLEKQQGVGGRNGDREMDVVRSPALHPDSVGPAPLNSDSGQQQQVQLWQFLLELLTSDSQLIRWTGQELEFQINQPDKVAELWGKVRNDPKMTYQKLAKGLCYYYTQGILKSVPEKLLTFRYTSWLKNYIDAKYTQAAENTKEMVVVVE